METGGRLGRLRSGAGGRLHKDGKRRGTPIPVQPPRVPTPIPAADTRVKVPPSVLPGSIPGPHRAQMAQRAQQYLDTNIETWINPRIYAKIDHDALKSDKYVFAPKGSLNQRYFQNAPSEERCCRAPLEYRQVAHRSRALASADEPCGHRQSNRQLSDCQPDDPNGHADDHVSEPAAAMKHHQSLAGVNGDIKKHHGKLYLENGKTHKQIPAELGGSSSDGLLAESKSNLPVYQSQSKKLTSVISHQNGHHHPVVPSYPKVTKRVKPNSHYLNGAVSVGTVFQQPTLKNYGALDLYGGCGSEVSSSLSLSGGVALPLPLPLPSNSYSEHKYSYSVSGVPGTASQSSTAAAFFARAAQKLNLSLPQWRKRDSYCDDGGVGFSGVLHRTPPVVPPALLRRLGVKEVSGVGKVKVMLRVCGASGDPGQGQGGQEATSDLETSEGATKSSSFFNVDTRRKQVTLFDPAACGGSSAPEDRRVGVAAPKMFAFDALFTQDDPQTEVCSSALTDVINAVINGNDGCLFCYGHAKLGKTHTMVGTPDAPGVIPCAISWLFRGINEQKQKTGARFSVRVSAVEVAGAAQNLRDLLAGHANDSEQSPGVYLRDDPLFGTQLQNQSELRVPTADKAAFYLDAALSSRSVDEGHLLYTLHVYQYSVAGKGGVAGGRSRLHLIDLASCDRGKASGGIPLSGIGNVLLAIFNGQKHLPYREHKLTQLLKECLSSLTCHAAMIAHVSPYVQHYTDTLATVQLASRIHRMRRRKIKFIGGSAGSSGSSGEEARLYENGRSTGSSDVDPSSSEQSADTVIYVGPSDDATDGEHPPVYIPSLNSGDNRCAMNKALRGSGAEHRPRHKPSTPHKLSNGSAEGSPTHRSSKISSVNGKPQISSTKSPVRTLKSSSKVTPVKEQDLQTVSPSKIPVPNGPVSGSDEQWIDGPRISKSKVAEARNLSKKKETWIDGPLQATKTVLGNGHASGVYGFMDSHKKSMIRKWVENQSVQSPRTASIKHLTTQRPPTTGGPASQQPYKELTVFKTCKDDEEDKTEPVQHKSEELAQRLEEFDEEERGVDKVNDTDNFCDKEKLDEEDEEGLGDIPPPLQLLHPQSKEMTLDVTKDNYDVRLHLLHGRHRMDLEGEEDDEMDEVLEIIEVEETMEQVPMQDSCLQVTEEDIAFCMGEMENPLPEVDQESTEEHPLRILSQENLTVVSTFADSISVTSEGRHRYSLYEQEDRFQQLARLHEMYKTKLAKASATPFRQPPSRCQSLSLSDMLYGEGCNDMCNSSIYSEPAFAYRDKICDNCKMSIRPRGGNSVWYKPSACNISSLRHPDGASNPNLKEEIERVPGNGASLSDHEEEAAKRREKGHKHTMDHLSNCQEDVRTVTGKAEDDDDDMLVLPPPLPAPVSSRLHARFFGKSSPQRLKETTSPSRGHQELNHSPKGFGYESAYKLKDANLASPGLRMQKKPEYKISPSHKIISPSHKSLKEVPCSLRHKDMSFISPSSRNLKESTLDLPSRHQRLSSPAHRGLKGGESGSPRCESSGYESVIRDSVSECSSLASSREFDNPPPDPAPPVPVLQYCREDVERLERRWTEVRGGRIKELQAEQQALKIELAAAKQRLLIPADRWSYELHVEGSMDFRDPSFVEALEKETHILKKRVVACKSHILMVTCFDTVSAAVDVD